MGLLTRFLLNIPYNEEQAWQPFAEIKLFQKHWQFSAAATAESHQSVSRDTCHFGYIPPTYAGSETPHPPDGKSFPDFQAFAARSTLILHLNYLKVLGVKI